MLDSQNKCIHQLFEKQVAKTPEATAVIFGNEQLTFDQLNVQANQLADLLIDAGVGPEVPVAICMKHSLEVCVGLLSILKAGGAYLPIDPAYPKERIDKLFRDSEAPILLTQRSLEEKFSPNILRFVFLDELGTISSKIKKKLNSEVTGDNLAYIIYTSGSTGEPKGVLIPHKALARHNRAVAEHYQLEPSDRILQFSSLSFDVAAEEIFPALLTGATVVHRPDYALISVVDFTRFVEKEKLTVLNLPTPFWHEWVGALSKENVELPATVRLVIVGSEKVSSERFKIWQGMFANGVRICNAYGTTETTITSTIYDPKTSDSSKQIDTVPIGKAIPNSQTYLLDTNLHPVLNGDSGELVIGGTGIARGYLNRPELTAEKFIPDPFSEIPGSRLYKSGDLTRKLPDGNIEFLGRIDNQVKIRGFRIELQEIEATLLQHPMVKETAAIVNEGVSGDKSLIAYATPSTRTDLTVNECRDFLQSKLPDYMLPSHFVMLTEMPRSLNGKIDRRNLPRPDKKRPVLNHAYVAPKTELQRFLAKIWAEILEIDRVGVQDRFFELGGNSIQAAKFINKLQEELGESIFVVTIFDAPTIEEYSTFLQSEYPQSIVKKFHTISSAISLKNTNGHEKIDSKAIAEMRECIPTLSNWNAREKEYAKNPAAIFILAPPRSGTTLLRVMLAGHPDLFATTELQLLGFNTLQERHKAFSGKFKLWLEGTLRAIMEVKKVDADDANSIMRKYEQKDFTTKEFYGLLQGWLGDKTLVDKSPSYVFDLKTLEKAEKDFENPLYIHLVRHPYAMVKSFERNHLDQVLFLKEHRFCSQQLAELLWVISHQNTLEFLKKIPDGRKCQIRFEDLVIQPKLIMTELCQKLGLKFHEAFLEPYQNTQKKMVDGIYKDSTPMGDTIFLEQKSINPQLAESWKGVLTDNFLCEITWKLAASFGYQQPANSSESNNSTRKRIVGRRRELLERRRQMDPKVSHKTGEQVG